MACWNVNSAVVTQQMEKMCWFVAVALVCLYFCLQYSILIYLFHRSALEELGGIDLIFFSSELRCRLVGFEMRCGGSYGGGVDKATPVSNRSMSRKTEYK